MNISPFALTVVILGLVLFGISDFMEDEPEASITREEIYAQHIPMADERAKSPDETCMYTSLNGREPGIPFTVVIPEGVTCLQIVGATK